MCAEPQPCCRALLRAALALVHLTPLHSSTSIISFLFRPAFPPAQNADAGGCSGAEQLLAGEFISFCSGSCFYFHFSRSQACYINQKKPDSAKFCPHLHLAHSSWVSGSLVALCTQYQSFWAEKGGLTHGKVLGSQPELVSVSLVGR